MVLQPEGISADFNNQSGNNNSIDIAKAEIGFAKISNGIQEAVLHIRDGSYSPDIIVMQKNIKTNWIIKLENPNTDNYRMFLPKYNTGLQFNNGSNPIDFTPLFDFGFSNWNGKFHGFIAVVDDINKVNNADILYKAQSYKYSLPSGQRGGSGGCCGTR